MDENSPGYFAPENDLALAHTPPMVRAALRTFFHFDFRLARLVAATSEPMLGQIRFAWWRDALSQPVQERPRGDAVLDALGAYWNGQDARLIALVDGWEHLLGDTPLTSAEAKAFVAGRAQGLSGLAALAGQVHQGEACLDAAKAWALGDAAAHFARDDERDIVLELSRELPQAQRLTGPLRGLAVLGALGRRSLARGGTPLMDGRMASLVALRAALFGR